MPPSSVYEGTSREAVERDVANRIMNPDGGLDLATARAMAKNEGNPSFQLPASSVMTREMKLAENAARDPNLFRSLAGGLTVDPFRRKAREWRFLQEQEDAIDAGVFGRAEDVRRLQQAGLSLEKIGEMTPEEMRRELAFTGANSSYDYMRGGKGADESQKELHSGLYNSVVDTHKDINRKLFGAKDSVVGGLFDRIADHYEVTTAQRQPDGIVGQAGHAIVRSVPDMFVRRLPEFAVRSQLGGGAAILTSIFSTIKEAASEGGAAYDEYGGKDPETWKKDALLAGLKTERENLHILGLSNTGQAALANRYMPKLMDAFKKGGKESYGKVFDFILDSVIEGGEEVAQGISSRKNLDQPMDIGELAFEGIVGAGASMLTAGLGAGYAKGFESYSARKAAGDAMNYWYPILDAKVSESRGKSATGYSREDAMRYFGIDPRSFNPKEIMNVPIGNRHAWVRMINEQEARKNAAPEAIADARRAGDKVRAKEAELIPAQEALAEEAAGKDDRDRLPVAEDRARDNYGLVAYEEPSAKLPHNPITQDDPNNPDVLNRFTDHVFDYDTIRGLDRETQAQTAGIAKDAYSTMRGENGRELPDRGGVIPWSMHTDEKGNKKDTPRPVDRRLEKLYEDIYFTIPEDKRSTDLKTFIYKNTASSNWGAATEAIQHQIRILAEEKRKEEIRRLQESGEDPKRLALLKNEQEQVEEREEAYEQETPEDQSGETADVYLEKQREQDNPTNADVEFRKETRKLLDAQGVEERLDEGSTTVDVANAVLALEDGWLASLLENADLNERQAGELERAVDHLNEIVMLMEKKKVSPETIQKVIDTVRERVKASVEANAKMWAVDKDDPTYADKEFAAIVSAVGEKYDISEPLMRTIAKRMDELYRKANDIKRSTTGRFIREHGGNIISKGVNRANSETAKTLLEIERLTRIIERNDSMDPDAEANAKFRIEKLKERLHELSTSSDMVAYIVNEMPKWKKPKPMNNFPQGITTHAIQKAIDHFNSHGDQGKGVADTLLNMWYADAKSNESYDAAMSKMREQRKANALSDQADQAFYNAAEEAEKRANSKRGKGMEVRGVSVAAFLQELEDVYVDSVASGNGKEFLLNLVGNMEDWKRKLGDTNTEAKTLASEMFDLYNALNLKSIPDLENTRGEVVVSLKEFHRNFPNAQSLRRMKNAIDDVRAWGEAQAATREEKANLLKEVVNLEQDKGIDTAASNEVFGTPAEQQETPLAEPGDTIYDSFPVGIVAGQQVATAPSSERTGLAGKIASVLLRANAKTPDAFNTVHDRMRKFINGKETIISHALDRMFDMAEKIPEIRDQVANIFNYSIGSGVSLASVDESVREDLQNVLTALDEVTRVRKDNGMTGGPKKSSDLVRSITHDMRDNPDFVPDPKALADFALGAMKDGKAMSFEEGLALAHKVLNRDAYGDFRLEQMPKYMQDLLGYSPDPLVQLYMNSRKLVRDTARQLFEKSLLYDTKVVADTQLEPDYVQLVSGDKAKYYSLEGKWVPPEVASVLQQDEKARNELVRGYLMIHSMFKQMKIIYSTTSYVNNFFGNFFLMQMGGVPLHESVKRYPKAAKEVFNWITEGKLSAGLKEAIDNGLFDNTMTSSELALSSSNMEALNKLKGSDFSKTNQVLFSALNKLENNKVGKFGRTLYEGIEQVHRYIAYQYFRDVGYTQDVNRKGLDPSAPAATMVLNLNPFRKKVPMSAAQAVAQVDKTLFNYRDLPTGVKALRDTGIPFISFPYLAGRSFLRNMTENPLGIISMVLTGMLLREAVRALTRGRKELELEGWIPYWEVIDPLQRSNKRWGEDWLDAIKGNFTPGGPMMMIPEIVRGKKFFGDIPISERRDREPTDGEIGRHVWDTMGPSVLVSGLRNAETVQKGKDSVGNRIFRQFGIRLRDSDRGALRKDLNRLNMKIREQQREYNRGNITYGDMMENIGKIRNAAEGLRKDFGSPFGVGP